MSTNPRPRDPATAPADESLDRTSEAILFQTTLVTAELIEPRIARCRIRSSRVGEPEAKPLIAELSRAAEAAGGRLIVDMTEVMLLLSAGIGAIIAVHKNCSTAGGRMVLFGLQPEIRQMLHLTGLPKVITIKDDEEKAAKAAR